MLSGVPTLQTCRKLKVDNNHDMKIKPFSLMPAILFVPGLATFKARPSHGANN